VSKLSNRTQVLIFLFFTFAISGVEQYFIINGGGIQDLARVFCLMWTPGIVGIICAFVFDRNAQSLAIKRPSLKTLAIAYFAPAITSVLIVALLVVFSLAEFQISPHLIEKKGGVGPALIAILLVAPTVGLILSFLSALGEEIGWRGFLHSKLLGLTPTRRYFLTGIIWSIWHWPLILFGDYANSDKPYLNLVCFTIAVVAFSFLMGWLRDKSNSSLPAALAHGSHNLWLQGISPVFFTAGPLVPYFGGESDVFCALIYLALACFIARYLDSPFGWMSRSTATSK
jgi:membrane protease YdiL (CAAX protease family)